jgi:hypothetical protein
VEREGGKAVGQPLGGNYGAIAFRDLGDGRAVWIYPMLYTFKIAIGPVDSPGYSDHWCYKDLESVVSAFALWEPSTEPEPGGWVRHPPTGRRRFPDGDPATEEVRD